MTTEIETTEPKKAPGRQAATAAFRKLQNNIEKVVRGKPEAVRLALACMLAEGHLLIEDPPGTGKTSLAKSMAASIGGTVRRVQFTPDLLPSDITGISIFNPVDGEFRFREGPVFANLLVADEINRASPKTQSALLEVMEERQITVDGIGRPVPRPFMVIATQNPLDFQGTYPLPEVQLDRFAMKISLGYANRDSELEIMARQDGRDLVAELDAVLDQNTMAALIQRVRIVNVAVPLREYVADIVERSRRTRELRLAISTRGTLTLLAIARAYALAEGRNFVSPDDIKVLYQPVLAHRIALTPEAELDGLTEAEVLDQIVDSLPVPRARQAP
ncbi:MAG: AAA family ATPase [Acidimicrobiia bacterium]